MEATRRFSAGFGRSLMAGAVLAGAYWLAAVVGLRWAAEGGAGSSVMPAAGVAMAGLLLGGVRLWPAVVVGRLLAAATVGSAQPLWVDASIAGGNALAAVLQASLLRRRARLDPCLTAMRDVLWLALGAAFGAAVSALVGTSALWLAAGLGAGRAAIVGSTWWFGNLVGALTVAPLVLAWRPRDARAMSARARVHLAAALVSTALVSHFVFLDPPTPYLRTWYALPAPIWAALAFQVRGAAAALAIVSAFSIWGATTGVGPFAALAGAATERVFFAQQFAAVASLTVLILAAAVDERRGKEALQRAEGRLRALNADLERRVAEEAAKLVQSQKMEGIGRLTGGVAHDFNNLLAVVLGNLEMLRKRLPPEDAHALRLLDNALHGARRGAALTQRLLAFARKQDLKPEPVDVPALMSGMTDLLSRSLGPRIKIEPRFAAGVPRAMVDAHQLEMAVLNLAVNARDAMPEGGTLTIEVDEVRDRAGGTRPPGPRVRLRVSDTGTGMDEATLARAAEPFFTTKGVGKGTGLGLPMVHGLAHRSGGHFALESEPGRGTTARLLLPVAPAAAEAAALPPPTPTAPTRAGEGDGPGGGRLTLLVVDDDALVRDNTAGMLEDLGHTAVEAASGEQALDLLRGGRAFDAVVTDHSMPGMTGVQLAEAIAAERPGLPVVLASGYAEPPEGALGAVTERLTKPFHQGQLAAALVRATGARRAVHAQDVGARPRRDVAED